MRAAAVCVFVCAGFATSALAQWDPSEGDWGRTQATDLRVMTWNVQDALCTTAFKDDFLQSWHACARIVAALRPDILILQECGDNAGNGTGSGVDSVANLTTVANLFLRGGLDPFRGNVPVEAYVQLYAPGYDLPHVYITTISDGFNRNIILSKYPFADLNGDSRSTYADIPVVAAHEWAVGGTGGIRGFQFAEIDLPDSVYQGNLVIGNGHLKAGGASEDHDDRVDAATNISYLIQYWYNGNGGATPDPANRIIDFPPATLVLPPHTPVIVGGDLNEDESASPSIRGPASYFRSGGVIGGSDGTDRDLSDSTFDDARDPINNSRTTQSSSKLDYLVWQDSIATLRRAFIFNSGTASPVGGLPDEIIGFPNPALCSNVASDHRPVIADFIIPLAPSDPPPGPFTLLVPAANAAALNIHAPISFTWTVSTDADSYSFILDDDADLSSPLISISGLAGASHIVNGGLDECASYFWHVQAINDSGSTFASNGPRSFFTTTLADLSGSSDPNDPAYGTPDGQVDSSDFFYYLDQFVANNLAVADLSGSSDPNDPAYGTPDGQIDSSDFFYYLDRFVAPCP